MIHDTVDEVSLPVLHPTPSEVRGGQVYTDPFSVILTDHPILPEEVGGVPPLIVNEKNRKGTERHYDFEWRQVVKKTRKVRQQESRQANPDSHHLMT